MIRDVHEAQKVCKAWAPNEQTSMYEFGETGEIPSPEFAADLVFESESLIDELDVRDEYYEQDKRLLNKFIIWVKDCTS
jgi:hypothetical protein